ncbi:MAG: DUF2285 domain-containing protein [Parasphingorhabdus sp.]|uniref:DNA -binding domain-containing protein n=1 Tax=Parasphingorhabdus sp. TaxID=2709688 RepID=UPI003002FFF4
MGTTEDWRSPDYGDQFEGYERPDFAQEFLRRNPAYIANYIRAGDDQQIRKEVARRWGLCVPFDPSLKASQSKALWDEKLHPLSLEIHGPKFDVENVAAEHQGSIFRNILLSDKNGDHYVIWKKTGSQGYQIVIPMCCDTTAKLKAAYRYWRHMEGRNAGPYPTPYRLTNQQRKRLADALQIIDAQKSGANKHSTAEILYDEKISLRAWSDSSERAHVRRLLKRGKYLSDEGYRKLLNPFRGTATA